MPQSALKDKRSNKIRAVRTLRSHGWSYNLIANVLDITPAQARRLRFIPRPRWTQKLIIKHVLMFYKKHKRWPNNNDFNKPVRNNLPSRETMTRVMNDAWRPRWSNNWVRREQRSNNWVRRKRQPITPIRTGWTLVQEEIAKRNDLTPHMILTLPNVTIRRQAVERYGFERLIKEKAASEINHDDFGKLWRITLKNEPNMMILEVVNATQEPDGSYAHYYLRVPPTMKTAQEAVAWSFNVTEEEQIKQFKIGVAT